MPKKKVKKYVETISKAEGTPTMLQSVLKWLEPLGTVLAIAGVIFWLGYWVAGIEHKVEIMHLNQQHNNEMYELKIQMNNQIQVIQNKYDILESNYNALKERKENGNG